MIKQLSPDVERKLLWLFVPMALVVIWEMSYLWFDYNILDRWFGINVDVLEWCGTALLCSLGIIGIGYGIAAIRQKCWGLLSIIIAVLVITLLNMNNVFINLFYPS